MKLGPIVREGARERDEVKKMPRFEADFLWEETSSGHPQEPFVDDGFSACAVLVACSSEARRLVREAAALDATVAEALAQSGEDRSRGSLPNLLSSSLQGLDLLCQEIDGLARVLTLLVENAQCRGRIPSTCFLEAIKLGAQRRRFVAEYVSTASP